MNTNTNYTSQPDIIPPPTRWQVAILFVLFLGIAIYGALVPFQYKPLEFTAAVEKFRKIPFYHLGIDSRADWVANLLLFMPLGFLGLAVLRMDARRSLIWSSVCFACVVVCGCIASGMLEFTQQWFPNRTVSQNDIFAETIGTMLGATIWLIFGERWLNLIRMWLIQLDPAHRLDTILFLVMIVHIISSALPLDLTIHPRELWHKLRDGHVIFIPGQTLRHLNREAIFEFALMAGKCALVGWLASRVYYRAHQRRIGLGYLAMQGLLFSGGIEFMQLFVYSRTTDINHVFIGLAGFVLGGWFMPVQIAKPIDTTTFTQRLGRIAICVVYLGCLLTFFWYPFDFDFSAQGMQSRMHGFFRVPFAALYVGSDYHAMDEIIRKIMLFALLVFLTGLATRFDSTFAHGRRWHLFFIFAFCALIGLLIEYVQIALPDHVADNTDVILYTIGSVAGCFLLAYLFPPISPQKLLRG